MPGNIEFFELVESFDCLSDEVWILACQCDSIGHPIDVCNNSTVARNVFGQIDTVGEQKHATQFQIGI